MSTTSVNRSILEQISMDIRRCSQAQAWAQHDADWRADALERAGELALAGRYADSREQALLARSSTCASR
jgi:hypothetical protein